MQGEKYPFFIANATQKLNVHKDSTKRVHQQKIMFLEQEIHCIIDILRSQMKILRGLYPASVHYHYDTQAVEVSENLENVMWNSYSNHLHTNIAGFKKILKQAKVLSREVS